MNPSARFDLHAEVFRRVKRKFPPGKDTAVLTGIFTAEERRAATMEWEHWNEIHSVVIDAAIKAADENHARQIEDISTLLEVERLRLAACDMVANSNTRQTAEIVRGAISQPYRSAALTAVTRTVDAEIALREVVVGVLMRLGADEFLGEELLQKANKALGITK